MPGGGNGAFEWHGDEAMRLIQTELGKRLAAAAITVQNHAKQLLSVEGTGVHKAEHEHHVAAPKRRVAAKHAKRAKKISRTAKRLSKKAARVSQRLSKVTAKIRKPTVKRIKRINKSVGKISKRATRNIAKKLKRPRSRRRRRST
jgi:hypothetical protein